MSDDMLGASVVLVALASAIPSVIGSDETVPERAGPTQCHEMLVLHREM
jgi:hypothetical protein